VEGAPIAVAVGDFNGDGKPDLAVANLSGNTVSILLGNGDGSFQTPAAYRVEGAPIAVAVGDFNGDGKPDLVVSTSGGDSVAVLRGQGDGTFQPAGMYGVGSGPGAVVVGDFNGDGKADIAVENFATHDVSVLLGRGDGTFAAAVSYGAGLSPGGLAAGDFNGDGVLDLAVANHNSHNVSILLGRGDGTFRPAEQYALGWMPAGVAVGDFNGDGRLDLAVVNHLSHTVSVLINRPPAPHFRIRTRLDVSAGAVANAALTALDAWNSADPAYTGTVVFTSSDPRALLPEPYHFPAEHQATINLGVTLRTAGLQTLTVVNPAHPEHYGRVTLLVTPGAATRFRAGAPAAVQAGQPCEITLTALDDYDNTDPDYAGKVRVTSDAPGATLPADHTFAAADEGRHVFRVQFPEEGEWTVTFSDTARRTLTGSVKVRVRR
jgi:hypothetical protein